MENFLYAISTGIAVGCVYAFIASGFVVIYRSGQVFNLCQGELLLFGAFLSCSLIKWTAIPVWAAIVLALGLSLCLGLIIERLAMRPLIGQPLFSRVIVTLALALVLKGVTMVAYGPYDRGYPVVFPNKPILIGSLVISQPLVWGAGITILLIIFVWKAYSGTNIGLKMSAVAEDHQIARSLGISIEWSMAIAWAFSAMVATGAAMVLLSGSVLNHTVGSYGLLALPAVLIGGMESIPGVMLGGLLIGISQSFAEVYLDPIFLGGISTIFPFIVMLIFMIFKPYGFFGWKVIERI